MTSHTPLDEMQRKAELETHALWALELADTFETVDPNDTGALRTIEEELNKKAARIQLLRDDAITERDDR